MGKTIQIRDVDDETYTVLRTRAAAEHMSLNTYLRRELERLANGPTMAAWVTDAMNRDWSVPHDTIAAAIRDIRSEDDE